MRAFGRLRTLGVWLAVLACWGTACRKHRPPRSGHAPAVVIRSPDDGAVPGLAEREPNDSLAQAEVLGVGPTWRILGALGRSTQGIGDVDTFRLTIPPDSAQASPGASKDGGADRRNSRLSLALLAGPGANLNLQLLDRQEQLVASLSCIRGTETAVPNIAVIPGEPYFLRVTATHKISQSTLFDAGVASLSYRLTAESGQFGPGDEREPNDVLATAESIGSFVGTIERAGYLSQIRDEDWYRLPWPPLPSALNLEVGPVEGVAIGLKIMDGRGNKLTGAVGQRGSKVILRNVQLPSEKADAGADAGADGDALYLVVRAETGQNREDRYVLLLNLGPVDGEVEIEPNDNPSQGTVVGEGTIHGFLSRGDVDYFRIAGHPDQTIEVRAVPPPRTRLVMEINRVRDGQRIGRQEAKTNHGLLEIKIASTGEDHFLIRLSPRKGEGNPTQPYTLSFVTLPTKIPDFPTKPAP